MIRFLLIAFLALSFCLLNCKAPNQVCGVCGLDVGAPYSIELNVTTGNNCPGQYVNGMCIVSGIAPASGCIEVPNCQSWDWFAMKAPRHSTPPRID